MQPPKNFSRWDVFIAVLKKNHRRAVFLRKKIKKSNLPPNLCFEACQ
jgi:hypothetical protein